MNLFRGSNMILACLCMATLFWRTKGEDMKCWSCLDLSKCKSPEDAKLEEFDSQTEWCCINESWRVPKDGGKPHIYSLWMYGSNPNEQKKFGMTLGCKRSTKQNEDGDVIKLAKCCCNTDGCNTKLNISVLEGPDGVVDSGARRRIFAKGLIMLSSFLTLPRHFSLLLFGGFVFPFAEGSPTNLSVFDVSPPSVYDNNDETTLGVDEGYAILSKELRKLFPEDDKPKGKIVHILNSAVTDEDMRNKGIFMPMMQCPEDWFVTEVRSIVEEDNTKPGGSGINQIVVKCSSRTDESQFHWLETKFSEKGDNRPYIYGQGPVKCPGGSIAIGFGMKSDKKGKGGATAFGIYCSQEKNFRRELPGSKNGGWLPQFMCPKESAICGIRLQFEPTAKFSDTTIWEAIWDLIKSIFVKKEDYRGAALTNVQMPCCEFSQRCTPHDGWEVLTSYDNTGSAEPFHNKFTKVSGTSTFEKDSQSGYSESEKNTEVEHKLHTEASAGIPGKLGASVAYDFKHNVKTSEKTGFNWANVAEHTFNEMTKHEYSYRVAPFINMTLEQVVGTCGHTKIYTDQLRRTDTDKNGKPVVQNYTAYDGAQRAFDVNVRIAFGLLSILLI